MHYLLVQIKIALTICEDLWNVEDDPMYINSPMDVLIKEEPKLMINIAASPFDHAHAESRKAILKRNANESSTEPFDENSDGIKIVCTFSGPSAVAARTVTSAESIPPLNPKIAFLKFCLLK